jgi:hypothetical protein
MRAAARNDHDVSSRWARTALSHRICTGLRRRTLGKLIDELSGPWMKAGEDRRERPHSVGGGVPPGPHARPDRGPDRGHRQPVRAVPPGQGQVDAGYRGLAKEFPDQLQAPPLKPKKDAPPEETAAYEALRHRQSSERICVEHANAEHKQWRTLQRYLGRREHFDETYTAIAALVSDRAADR